jgi:ATP-dependent protease Clp ATPase subunit
VTDPGNHLSCSFCGKIQKQVKKLIAGLPASAANPHFVDAFICDECIGRAHAVIAEPGRTVPTPIGAIQLASNEAGAEQCSFCHKRRHQVEAMASAGDRRICDECLALSDEILSEEPPVPAR